MGHLRNYDVLCRVNEYWRVASLFKELAYLRAKVCKSRFVW